MKTTLMTLITALLCGACQLLLAGNTVIAISPDLRDESIRADVKKHVLKHVLVTSEPGETISILDAVSLRKEALFTIPAHPAYKNNPKARYQKLKGQITRFKRWVDSKREPMANPYHMDITRVFGFCAANLHLKSGKDKLVLIGSSVHVPKEEAYSMHRESDKWLVPADANLTAHNEYGFHGSENLLNEVEVSWVTLGNAGLKNQYAEKLKRWWTLFCRQRNAKLVSYDDNAWVVFDNLAKIRRPALGREWQPDMDSKPEMLLYNPTPVTRKEEAVKDTGASFMVTENIATEGLTSSMVQGLKAGAKWNAKADIDIYVRRKPRDKWIYFGYAKTPYGQHRKDYTSAPPAQSNNLETVELWGDVNIRELEIAVNLYSGYVGAAGVKGVVRIYVQGNTYEATWHIKAAKGNKGHDLNKRAISKYWVVLDPVKIVKLGK